MNIAICDDEQQVTEQVKNILEMLQIKYDVELKIFQFCDAKHCQKQKAFETGLLGRYTI